MLVHILVDGIDDIVTEDQVMDIVAQCQVEGKPFEVLEYLIEGEVDV